MAEQATQQPSDSYVQSFARGLSVIRAFGPDRSQMTLSEVAAVTGLTRAGESFYLGKNNVALTSTQLANAGKRVAEGDYRDSEFCGACWDPTGETLFVNLQSPGITVAITGPWQRGPL